MRISLALLAALAAAIVPSAALADASTPPPADAAPACLPAKGSSDALGIRGVHVGGRAVIKDSNGNPLDVSSVSYCVVGGGTFSFALTQVQDVVLVLSTADGDSIGPINPTSPAPSARAAFPNMQKLTRSGNTTVYRVDNRRQFVLGVAGGRVNFVAAADRLLLEYPHKLGYYMRRLGF